MGTICVIEDITVQIYRTYCGGNVFIDNATTNTAGYYSFGNLPNDFYNVFTDNASYLFSPEFYNVQIPQAAIQSYDFSSTDPSHPIIGTWTSTRNSTMFEIKFKSNGNFDLHGWIDVGTYTISGNQITLLDINCGTQEGIYTYSINENTLNFVLISDSCSGRPAIIPGDWESVLISNLTQLRMDTFSDELLQTNGLWLCGEE